MLFDLLREIATISIFHHNVEFVVGGYVNLLEFDYVRVVECLENLSLLECFVLLGLRHFSNVHLLDDAEGAAGFLFHKVGLAESPFSQELQPLVDILLRLYFLDLHSENYNLE